jgi:hypothetical protein
MLQRLQERRTIGLRVRIVRAEGDQHGDVPHTLL